MTASIARPPTVMARRTLPVIASAAKQSIAPQAKLDCFVARAPRNDGWFQCAASEVVTHGLKNAGSFSALKMFESVGLPEAIAVGFSS